MPQLIYETLPCNGCVDLDECGVYTIQYVLDDEDIRDGRWPNPIDTIVDAGVVSIADGDGVREIHWGKTDFIGDEGYHDIIVDAPSVTLEIVQALWLAGVVGGDYPEAVVRT